jgi:hypothetical protein
MHSIKIPTPTDLDRAPELAVIAALDAALKASVFAMISAHPSLRDPDSSVGNDAYLVASVFLAIANQLGEAISAYHRAIECEPAIPDSEFPF